MTLIDHYPASALEPEADLYTLADTIEETIRAARAKMHSLTGEPCHPDTWPSDTPIELENAAYALQKALTTLNEYLFPNGKFTPQP